MKREVRILLSKATDSVLLGIEQFNRPWDRGRQEAILIFIDRAFELLLKSVILYKGGKIREARAKETIGFDACVRKCVSDAQVKCITAEEAITVQILNSLRDTAQHYILDISEDQLYIYAQASLTLFDKILREVFGKKLIDYLPERILPISSKPPSDFGSLMEIEFEDTKRLLKPGSRKEFNAKAKLRSFAIIEASLNGSRLQPSDRELSKLISQIRRGRNWQQIFPGIKRLVLNTDGEGLNVSLKITKKEGQPVHLVPEGTPGATIVAVRKVNELSYYTLSLSELATKLKLSQPKLLAVIRELKMQGKPELYREFKFGTALHKRYSPKALDCLAQELPNLDIDKIWKKQLSVWSSKKS